MQDFFKPDNEASASIIESIRENYLEIIEPFKKVVLSQISRSIILLVSGS